MDLLFFPTGGGKTEAYLGLAAFTLVLRRLRNPGIASAGLSVLMRYTLRLLTLDQLGRAATLICALELERQKDAEKLGDWPFEIGLWVGRAATPNRMGSKGDGTTNSARAQDDRLSRTTTASRRRSRWRTAPGAATKFKPNSFQLVPESRPPDRPARSPASTATATSRRDQPLPILAVDEPIYRRLPCFLIATVDKFAAMPWTGEVGAFFGRVGPLRRERLLRPLRAGRRARRCRRPLLPPDLIIQDELHLISGPLGTMVGLYETALDELCSREVDGKTVRPEDRRLDGDGAPGREPDPRAVQSPARWTSSRRPGPTAATRSSPARTRPQREQRPALPRRGRPGAQPQGRAAARLPGPARRPRRSGTRPTAARRTRTTRPIRT